jgi:CheY-like chemotaxis protein
MRPMAGSLATVLICEDEPALRELVRLSLDGQYAFAEAEDGMGCLERAREIQPDLIVLDMMLPGMTGLEVLDELRRDPQLAEVPVIVLTAQPAAREDALRAGANLVMDKPFNVDDISAAVKEVLSGSS